MRTFHFEGTLPASKSMLNRALIAQSYFPELKIIGDSKCDDVQLLKSSLQSLFQKKSAFCGLGGTTFRFAALRASRLIGNSVLLASPSLLHRPIKPLLSILDQVGVLYEAQPNGLKIQSSGWSRPASPLKVDGSESSQFASSLILNSWSLDFDLEIELTVKSQPVLSRGYLEMTVSMMKQLGMTIESSGSNLFISKGQIINNPSPIIEIESDMSCGFTIAAFAALCGSAQILNFPKASQQSDFVFCTLLSKMGVSIKHESHRLIVNKAQQLKFINVNLGNAPDLFPVLSVLCAMAEGKSKLWGAPHLINKESNRIQKTAELLKKMGRRVKTLSDGIEVQGSSEVHKQKIDLDPCEDHRMVMATALVARLGFEIEIKNPQAVDKSFPEFWSLVQ